MVYQVFADGQEIYDPSDKRLTLLDPKLEMEVNTAGSFEFTMPAAHEFYDSVKMLLTDIDVYEGGQLIWSGRPIEIKTDFYKQKQVYCEGAFAFFNDSVQEYHIYWEISVHKFFRTVIETHNSQVAENRQFQVGKITVPDKKVYRKLNYEQTINVLNRQCLNAEGGYFFVRKEDGVNYIDWLSDMPYSCNQPIEFGLNLLDIGSNLGGSEIATCVLPVGEEDPETHLPVTVESVNGGSKIIESDAVETFGRITKAVSFSGVTHPDTLLKDGKEYLENLQFDKVSIECDAAELHFLNNHYEMFRVGQMVHCVSRPHLVEKDLPLMRMSLQLDTATKQVTLGSVQEQNLTEIVAEAADTPDSEDLEDLEDQVDNLEDQVDDLQQTVDDYTDKVDDYTEKTDGLEDKVDDYSSKTDDLLDSTEKYQELADNYDSYTEKTDQCVEDLNDLSEQVSSNQEDISSLQDKINELSETVTEGWSHWIGTQEEYDAIESKDEKTVYLVRAVT